MAGVSSDQDSGELNVELNLVPFIDLLSSLVLFLLVTAVWLQVSTIPASVESKGRSTTSKVPQQKLTIHLTANGYRLSWPSSLGSLPGGINKNKSGYDTARLAALLEKVSKKAKIPLVAVSADDSVEYGAVVEAIDAVKTLGHAVALSTN